ncbi:MAG: polymer-forming cytoskeletal protein [Bacteroidales bacterium]|nr:polymer-forming cytoskeletal protein [Bacteroidales bacterium]
MAKTELEQANNFSIIALGTDLDGTIKSNGSLRIAGKFNGNINLSEYLYIDQTGIAEGEITCKNAKINGSFKGKLIVQEHLELLTSAVVEADISTNKIVINEGAIFTGTCKMDSSMNQMSDLKNNEKR